MKISFHIFFLLLAAKLFSQQPRNYFDRFITDTALKSAHLGVAVYDPSNKSFLHSYQSDKYFVPASNTKIFTCYAALKYLPDTISIEVADTWWQDLGPGWAWTDGEEIENYFPTVPALDSGAVWTGILDSLLRPMMFRSDNFLAEQLLRTVIKQQVTVDTILNNLFRANIPRPRWEDGCGLSRYNFFSPLQFVFVLDKLQQDYGMARMRTLFPTGTTGTLKNYYMAEKGNIFAKTGSLTGVVALSGFVYTNKKKLLIFSVLVNNHNGPASVVRRRVERFIKELRRAN